MLAIHDQFTQQMRNRLKTTGMGLGLVRLLQDARRTEEAISTLSSLETGFRGVESPNTSQNLCKTNRLVGVSKRLSVMALSAMHELVPGTN